MGVASAAHALLFAALLAYQPPQILTTRAIQVELVPLSLNAHPLAPPPKSRAPTKRRPAEQRSPELTPATVVAASPSVPLAPTPPSPAPALTPALRARLGCAFADAARLTDAERQHCAERLAANDGHAGEVYQLSADQRAYFEVGRKRDLWWQEPFLAEDPKNGCRPRVTNQQSSVPGGSRGMSDWRAGIGCKFSF